MGSSFVELVTGLLVLIPISLVLFDLAVIVIAVQINDSTCREAARVAASGNPLDAQTRAMAIIDRANLKQSMASNFSLVSVNSTISAQDIQAVGVYGGPLEGTVTVETDVQVKPFVVQYIYNGQNPLHFRSKQSFPFTYVVPNTTFNRIFTSPMLSS